MRKTLIAAALLGASMTSQPLLAQTGDAVDPAVGKQIYALKAVEEKQMIGSIRNADENAFRIQIGEHCVGLPRQEFIETDGQFRSPWTKEALEQSIRDGNANDFICTPPTGREDPAIGKEVFAMKVLTEEEMVGTVRQATQDALLVQIGEQCVGLPRPNFTQKDDRFESPWSKASLEETMSGGNPEDFTCPA